MSRRTIIERDGKPEYVVLPWDDYERLSALAEEAEDRRALERFDAEDDGDRLPAHLARRLIAGENPVRVWRQHRGLTGKALADAAGVGQPHISMIEKGERDGTLPVMRRIADALRVSLDDLYP